MRRKRENCFRLSGNLETLCGGRHELLAPHTIIDSSADTLEFCGRWQVTNGKLTRHSGTRRASRDDDYDRDINRMKNDARAARERRQSLFPQINEDFQRVQVIHNELVRMLQSDKGLDYGRLADLGGDLKKRG